MPAFTKTIMLFGLAAATVTSAGDALHKRQAISTVTVTTTVVPDWCTTSSVMTMPSSMIPPMMPTSGPAPSTLGTQVLTTVALTTSTTTMGSAHATTSASTTASTAVPATSASHNSEYAPGTTAAVTSSSAPTSTSTVASSSQAATSTTSAPRASSSAPQAASAAGVKKLNIAAMGLAVVGAAVAMA